MFIKYTPREGEPAEYQFDLTTMTSGEAEAIERVTDWTYVEFQEKLIKGSMLARRAMLWVLRKREQPSLRFSDLTNIFLNEVELDFDSNEKAGLRDWLDRNPDADPDARDAVSAYLGEEFLSEASEELAAVDNGAGKGPKGKGPKGKGRSAKPNRDAEATPPSD